MPISEVHIDLFRPVLKSGTIPSLTTGEQLWFIREILDLSCSDSRFAEKAYAAILLVLNGGIDAPVVVPPVPPVVSTLTPNTITVGDPDFTLVVTGSGFTSTSVIYIRGVAAPTTLVSPTEVSTPIDMALVVAPGVAPVMVIDGSLVSNTMDFTVVAAPPIVLSTSHAPQGKK